MNSKTREKVSIMAGNSNSNSKVKRARKIPVIFKNQDIRDHMFRDRKKMIDDGLKGKVPGELNIKLGTRENSKLSVKVSPVLP